MEIIKISVITINYNGARFLEETIRSVLEQKSPTLDLEYILIDGGSTDNSINIIDTYRDSLTHVLVEADEGPVDAINKGLRLASGELIAWLNSDDCYTPGALSQVVEVMRLNPQAPFYFGRCVIVDEQGAETRKAITAFKEIFFPISSRFTYQCINYISQPALFFRRSAQQKTGFLDKRLVAAWDYQFILKLWHQGVGKQVPGRPLARFRWNPTSISGRNFTRQFHEEFTAAKDDAGVYHPAIWIHYVVQWMIIAVYSAMAHLRQPKLTSEKQD